ncbi:MAG: hypothetical protein HQ472_09235 [Ignavibacteria bacterium]|nr:hypothetical protein [Ignavibacteria bacterium]
MSDQHLFTYELPISLPTEQVMVELLPEFVDSWVSDLTVTWTSITKSMDTEELYRFGHTVKGSFMQFGFKDLSKAGAALMSDAANSDWETASKRIQGILEAMYELKKRLHR